MAVPSNWISNYENNRLSSFEVNTYSLLTRNAETSRFSCSTVLTVTMSLNAAGAISEHTVPSEKALSTSDKSLDGQGDVESATFDADSEEGVLSNEREIATHIISVDDDPSLNPWTFRAFFIGLGLSTFGGVLGELFFYS
jgi:hypothetical protein